jgi:hypothetical protein
MLNEIGGVAVAVPGNDTKYDRQQLSVAGQFGQWNADIEARMKTEIKPQFGLALGHGAGKILALLTRFKDGDIGGYQVNGLARLSGL